MSLHERALGEAVREVDAARHGGRSARGEVVDGGVDAAAALDARGREDLADAAGVRAERDRIALLQGLREEVEALLGEADLVGRLHRSARVDEVNEVDRQAILGVDALALYADAQEMVALRERRGR